MSAVTDDAVRAVRTARDDVTVRDVARWLAALAMLGAAVIHFAFAPEHLSQSSTHGIFFLVVAWAQLGGAMALAFDWRPARAWLVGSAALNAAVAGVWLLSRTSGVPGEAAEPVGFPDSLATALEVVAVAAALALAFGWLVDRPVHLTPLAVAGVPALAVVAVVTASVVPSLGGGHTHAAGDAHAGGGPGHDEAAAAGGHDHGTAGGAAATPANWDKTRYAALTGYLPATKVDEFKQINKAYLANILRTRSRVVQALPADEQAAVVDKFTTWSVNNALEGENGAATSAMPTMHSHGIEQWQNITNPADQAKLQAELETAGTVIPKMATAAAAVKAGYFQVTPYVPGIGAHYLNVRLLTGDGFNPAQPEMLLYNGNEPSSKLIGLSYAVLGDKAPAGFTGPNDTWHVHPSLCIVGNIVVGPDSTPQALCDSVGGHKGMPFGKPMWMGHLWQVPGWESPWGLFSGENPVINMATTEVGR
jgi:hypothetical protein